MPVRRQVALAVAVLIAVALATIPSPPNRSAVEVTSPPDPPNTTFLARDERLPRAAVTSTTTTTVAKPPPEIATTTTEIATIAKPVAKSAPPTSDRFDALARCESGGDPTTNTGNGYYGAFQFDLQTWASTGRSGLPSDHSYGEQKAAAIELQAARGWYPWPRCSRRLGYL